MSTPGGGHRPVLLDRVLALLGPALDRAGAILVDATLGRAGHAHDRFADHPVDDATAPQVPLQAAPVSRFPALAFPTPGRMLVALEYESRLNGTDWRKA